MVPVLHMDKLSQYEKELEPKILDSYWGTLSIIQCLLMDQKDRQVLQLEVPGKNLGPLA